MDSSAPIITQEVSVSQMVFIDPKRVIALIGVRSGMNVADFGVGRGYYAMELARVVGADGKVTGVDVISEALDNLDSHLRAEGLSNVELVQADLEIIGGTNITSESQDLVLLANILFQSQQKENIINESKRVLKKSASLCIIDWQKGAGGLGPPDDVRIEMSPIRQMIENQGFTFIRDIETDSYHYGLLFSKN